MLIRTTLAAAITAVALLGTAGCAGQSAGAYMDDATVTAGVKAKLLETKDIPSSAISVETLNGMVQLAGFVKTAAEKTAAEEATRKVAGVKSVKNDLVVRP